MTPHRQVDTAERPTIVLVAHGIHDAGGMEHAFAQLVRKGSSDFKFVVVASELDPALRRYATWIRVPLPSRLRVIRFALFFIVAGLRLRRAKGDLVHTLGAIVPNRVDVACVQFCHAGFRERTGRLAPPTAPPLRRLNTAIARLLAIRAERWSYRPSRLRRLAAVSRGIEDELRRHYPGVATAITPNGVDVERFRPDASAKAQVRAEQGAAADDLVCLFVGGDWDRKGLAIAIEGLAHAAIAEPSLRLWVVGSGDENRFRAIARSCGVADKVSFLGFRADTERLFQGADVFVFPTEYEAAPLVALEAAASGLPIVGCRVNGIDELVGEDETGLLVERSPQAVGAALARLALDPSLLQRLAEAARARAEACTWNASVASVGALYHDLLPALAAAGERP